MSHLVVTLRPISHCDDPLIAICGMLIIVPSFSLAEIIIEPSIRREPLE